MEKEEKEALFKELWALDDDVEDEGEGLIEIPRLPSTSKRRSHISHVSASSPNINRPVNSLVHQPNIGLSRTTSAPQTTAVAAATVNNPFHLTRPQQRFTAAAHLLSTEKVSIDLTKPPKPARPPVAPTSKMASRASAKRKREPELQMQPEENRVFRDSSFFFYPNDDAQAARKFRIRRFREYGGTWVREWRPKVITHVILDRGLTFQNLRDGLMLEAIPEHLVVVNETFPADCIEFGLMVRPTQWMYEVKDPEKEAKASSAADHSKDSEPSLELKPVKTLKGFDVTPSRTESSGSDFMFGGTWDPASTSPAFERPQSPSPAFKKHEDALSEAIVEAQATKDLPLDTDEDADDGSSAEPTSALDLGDTDSEEERPRSRSKKSKPAKSNQWQERFSCMSSNDGKSGATNPNARTVEVLQEMASYYDTIKDHWRTMAYRKAIAQLKKCNAVKITTSAQAIQIPFIGQRLADKIEEIVWTNKLRRLENTKLDATDETLKSFLKIYGVGFAQATRWIEQGHRSLTDLTTKASLTRNQEIGIAHYNDFNTRIPRDEMQQHDRYIRDFAAKIDKTLQFTIGGSYRRGSADSGDVDFIITKAEPASLDTIRTIMTNTIIPRLFDAGYLKCGLATPSARDSGGSKWHGACCLPPSPSPSPPTPASTTSSPGPAQQVWRRIDFLFVPPAEIGAALIYFTGNDIFNRSIRLLASKKGMRLNQRGLWKDVMRGPGRSKVNEGTLVEGRDERVIFERLGVPWREPWERVC